MERQLTLSCRPSDMASRRANRVVVRHCAMVLVGIVGTLPGMELIKVGEELTSDLSYEEGIDLIKQARAGGAALQLCFRKPLASAKGMFGFAFGGAWPRLWRASTPPLADAR